MYQISEHVVVAEADENLFEESRRNDVGEIPERKEIPGSRRGITRLKIVDAIVDELQRINKNRLKQA